MEQSFQDGCDTIVNGCTTYGNNPETNSPVDIVEAIKNIYNDRYNTGIEEGIILGKTSFNLSTICYFGRWNSSRKTCYHIDTNYVTETVEKEEFTVHSPFIALLHGCFYGRDGSSGTLQILVNGITQLSIAGGYGSMFGSIILELNAGDIITSSQTNVSNSYSCCTIYHIL